MKIQIDKSKKVPLYRQIAEQIQMQIASGEIPEGFQFPSERQLADALGVNRTTVLNAYKELKADGLMVSHVGRGTIAAKGGGDGVYKENYQKEPIWEYLYSDYLKNHDNFDVNKYLEIANQKNVISFAAGIASFEHLPFQAYEGLERELLSKQKELLVSPVTGFSSLRQAICSYMEKRSCFCKPSEIMVLSGSQQGIDLIARAFVNPGDVVIIEEPSFFPAIQSFRMAGAKLMAVPVEEDGMNMDILEHLMSRYQPKLIYTMPVYHNPSGVSMSMTKRIRLLELSGRYGVPVLEDDPYSELYYEGESITPLKSMDKSGYVIYLSTFSKTVSPGLRLGWMCAGKKLIHELANIRQLVDLHANCISQLIAERFIVSGQMEIYLESIRKEYRDRRDIMTDALRRYAPSGLSWNSPAGGYYLWCRLPRGLPAEKLASEAAKNGVAVLPGMPSFLVNAKGENYIRLNYTFPPKNKIAEGIRILCEVIKKLISKETEEVPVSNEINPIL
ncbi:MAG: PLP-dependent aminotransferase family protein [Eubacteriales bacterium]|nr:PLP-dependent aminotransferase family protein [Eubacteriales bacterium]